MSCAVCKNRTPEEKDKVLCGSCKNLFHLKCVNVHESYLLALKENSISWSCGQCVKKKRINRSVSVFTEGAAPTPQYDQLGEIKYFLEKFRNDITNEISKITEEQKQLEIDLGKSIETCHQKLDENLCLLREQGKILERQQSFIDDLKSENSTLKQKLKELSLTGDSNKKPPCPDGSAPKK